MSQNLTLSVNNKQHDLKNKNTATAGSQLKSIISRATDSNCYVVMASLGLSMAFDKFNIELLARRLKIGGNLS